MPSNYDDICRDNIRRRGEEFDDIGQLISQQLYSDKTHFIFELLQNAEDALERRFKHGAAVNFPQKVRFLLHQDRLEFRHYGAPFSTADVKGISDVLKGTKKGDIGQIGTFGIGFKSVYAFTSSPEIHSNREHFVIKRYIRPEAKEPEVSIDENETVFIFPFDHQELSANDAFHLIQNKLRGLGPKLLLFLKYINEIEWQVVGGKESGQYLKDIKEINGISDAHFVTVLGLNSGIEEVEDWLLFERKVESSDSLKKRSIEVAFKVERDDNNNNFHIIRIERAPLVVYFPTEKMTNFGFLMQGPYKTTPARDNVIADDSWNKQLVDETACTLTAALHSIKMLGLLTISALETLPVRMEDFSEDSMFYPIAEAVRKSLMNETFLPTDDGDFVSGQEAKLASAEWLRILLKDIQLQKFFNSERKLKWISGEITERLHSDVWKYIRERLKVEEITPDSFARKISLNFLEEQTDEWFVNFYGYLQDQKSLWKPREKWQDTGPLRNKPFIRLEDGSHTKPFEEDNSPKAFLADQSDSKTTLPIVKLSIIKNCEARTFLKELGIPELDIVSVVIAEILPKYDSDMDTPSTDDHKSHISIIIRALKSDSLKRREELKNILRRTRFVRAESIDFLARGFKMPEELYIRNEKLGIYFFGNQDIVFVSSIYDDGEKEIFKSLGAEDSVRIMCGFPRKDEDFVQLNPVYHRGYCYRRGEKGFDPDIKVDGLEYALHNPENMKSRVIWNEIAIPYSRCVRGSVIICSRQDFSPSAGTYSKEEQTSDFGNMLMNNVWLPDNQGVLRKPSELMQEDLPRSFNRDLQLAKQLGMKLPEHEQALNIITGGNSDRKKFIEYALSVSDDDLQILLKMIPREEPPSPAPSFKDGLKDLSRPQRGSINEGSPPEPQPVSEPGGYTIKLKDQVTEGVIKHKTTTRRITFSPVRETQSNKESREYLYQQYKGYCQITGSTFPKASINQDGEADNYFEACALLSYADANYFNDAGNMLCVSADTMAKLKHASFEFIDSIEDTVNNFNMGGMQAEEVALKILLAGKECTITWSQRHFMRLVALYENT